MRLGVVVRLSCLVGLFYLSFSGAIAASNGEQQGPKKAERIKRARVRNEIIDYVKPTSQNPEAIWAMAGIKPTSIQLEEAQALGTNVHVCVYRDQQRIFEQNQQPFPTAGQKVRTGTAKPAQVSVPRPKSAMATTVSLWLTFEGTFRWQSCSIKSECICKSSIVHSAPA